MIFLSSAATQILQLIPAAMSWAICRKGSERVFAAEDVVRRTNAIRENSSRPRSRGQSACRKVPALTTIDPMSEPIRTFEPTPQLPLEMVPTSQSIAVDAVVLENSQVPNPYSPPPLWQGAYPLPYKSQYPIRPPLPREKVYSVPKRFGLAALLALITALACLFGALRLVDTPPVVYLFLGTQVMMICVAQMFYNAEPRRASMIAGAILMPMFSAGSAFFLQGNDQAFAFFWVIPGILFGAFAGYLIGTCVAGIFLLMDKLEPFLPGGKKAGA